MDTGQEGSCCVLPYLNFLLFSLYENYAVLAFYGNSKEEKVKINGLVESRGEFYIKFTRL